MPILVEMPYIKYSFTEEEAIIAASFTELQLQFLQTELAIAVQERNALSYDPSLPESKDRYIFEMEYLRGQISVFQLLIDRSEDLQEAQRSLMKQKAEDQESDFSTL